MKITITTLILLVASCTISTPFKLTDLQPDGTLIIGITEVTLKDDSKKKRIFWDNVKSINASIKDFDGLIGYSAKREIFGNKAWTLTVWQDIESINNFTYSPIHQKAMNEAWSSVDNARFAKIKINANQYPINWSKAIELLDSNYYEIPHYE